MVRTYDKPYGNETAWSPSVFVTIGIVDNETPKPDPAVILDHDPDDNTTSYRSSPDGGNFWFDRVYAQVAVDDSGGPVWYLFKIAGVEQDWQQDNPELINQVGQFDVVDYQVRYRDEAGNETGWSPVVKASSAWVETPP
jgi:hypothetical protein